jgi:hypothetical protein
MKGLKILLIVVSMLIVGTPVWAADATIEVLGAPTTLKQGEEKSFVIRVAATGGLNASHSPAEVSVDTEYELGGNSAGQQSATFVSVDRKVSGGPYDINAKVIAPANLIPGVYPVVIAASSTNGIGLPTDPVSFSLEVTESGREPSVSIKVPLSGAVYKVAEVVDAQVEVQSSLDLSAVTGSLNGTPMNLALVSEERPDYVYETGLVLNIPGKNTFSASATNSVGTGSDSSEFSVLYDFGGWLPPITTAKFQAGRTLPVKFRVGDFNGPTDNAIVQVILNGQEMGVAFPFYDASGIPYYQLDVKLGDSGPCEVKLKLDDGTEKVLNITVK